MKQILILISLFLIGICTINAQSVTANQMNGRLQMTTVSNVSDSTWSITGYFTNSVNKYLPSNINVNDKFFCQIGANTYVGRISVINSRSDVTKLITFRVICNYPNPPNNIGAIIRATSNGYPVFVDGLPNALQAGIQNYFATLINTNAAGNPCERTITKTAHGYVPGTPLRWNGSAYVRPTIDSLIPDLIVVKVLTANTFVVSTCGVYPSDLPDGLYWYTSAAPGYSLTQDTVKVPLFQVLRDTMMLNPIVGFNLMSGSGDVTSSVLADTAAAIRADFKNGIISELPLDDVVINTSGNSLKLKNALDSIVTNANSEKLLEITGTYDSDPTWQSTLSYYDYGYLYARTAGSAFDATGRIAIERSRGTLASPTTVLQGDRIGEITFRGRGSSSFRNAAMVFADVDSVATNSVQGVLKFGVAKDGEPYLTTNRVMWLERLKARVFQSFEVGRTAVSFSVNPYTDTLYYRGTARFASYGTSATTAATLGETESGYIASFATGGKIVSRADNTERYNTITSTSSPQTLSSTIADNLINQGGTQGTFTFRLPASPVDGQISKATFANTVTVLTIDGNGTAVTGTLPTTVALGTQIIFKNYTGVGWVRQL